MANYKNVGNYKPVSAGIWELIEDYSFTSNISTKTFSFTGVDFNSHSMLVLILDGKVTGAMDLYLKVGGKTADYFYDGVRHQAGATTEIDAGSQAQIVIMSTAMLGGANATINGIIEIMQDRTSVQSIQVHSRMGSSDKEGFEILSSFQASSIASLAEIIVNVSANNISNGRMTLYKVKRT